MSKEASRRRQPNAAIAASPRKSGRAVFDGAGNSSWEWQTSTGVFERNISDQQLQALTPADLQLVDQPDSEATTFEWRRRGAEINTGKFRAYTAVETARGGPLTRLVRRVFRRS